MKLAFHMTSVDEYKTAILPSVDGEKATAEQIVQIIQALNNDYMSPVIVAAMVPTQQASTTAPVLKTCESPLPGAPNNDFFPFRNVDMAKGLDALHMANANTDARAAIVKARDAGVDWKNIIVVLLGQVPNMLKGNWAAVVAAVIGLIVPKA